MIILYSFVHSLVGEYACCYCEDRGRPRPRVPQVRDWPYTSEAEYSVRTADSWCQNVKNSLQHHSTVSTCMLTHKLHVRFYNSTHSGQRCEGWNCAYVAPAIYTTKRSSSGRATLP